MKRLAAALLIVAAVAPPSHAIELKILNEPLRLDVTESLFLNWHGDLKNGDPASGDYYELLSRLNVQLAWRGFLIGFRYDTAGYANVADPNDPVQQQTRVSIKPNCGLDLAGNQPATVPPYCVGRLKPNDLLTQGQYVRFRNTWYDPRKFFEKFFLSYSGRAFDATLGDFYVNFGRGLVLSIRKLDELGVDTTLLGGKFALHTGDLSAVAVAGFTNIQNVDEASATYVPDPFDFIAGVHADYRIAGKVLLGAHVMGGIPNPNPVKNPDAPGCGEAGAPMCKDVSDYYLRYGATLDAPRLIPWAALYAEYARGDDNLAKKHVGGNALYGAATVFAGDVTILGELKWYDNYVPWHSSNDPFGSLVYMQPPTLERVQTQINNNTDILAGRATVDYRVTPSLLVTGSWQVGQSHPTQDSTDFLFDTYGGARIFWDKGRSHFFPLLGYRLEHDDTNHLPEERLIALEWDFAQALPRGFSIETQGLVWLRKKGLPTTDLAGNLPLDPTLDPAVAMQANARIDDSEWREGNVYVAVKWAPRFVLAAGYEFTTLFKELQNQHNFFNGTFQWNITPATSIRIFGGGMRPGLKCVSGVCRVFPAFNGVKLEVVVRL